MGIGCDARESGPEMIRPLICEWGNIEHEKYAAEMIAKSGLEGHRVMVFDGTYGLMPNANWFRNRPSDDPLQRNKSEKYRGWFPYRTASFRRALTSNVSAFSSIYWDDRENSSVAQFAKQVVMNSYYRASGDSPAELNETQRQKISEGISELVVQTPELPDWLFPSPVAAIGEIPLPFFGECGSVSCPVTEEFALEIKIEWRLQSRDATAEEIEILEEQLR
jgi:hypothetical protein